MPQHSPSQHAPAAAGQASRLSIDTPIRFRDRLPPAVDVVIIGGGVIGVFAALYLARSGQRVLLCEKGRVAAEQSSRNWGWIRQQGRDAAEIPIMQRARTLWLQANADTNDACGVRECGITYLALSDSDAESHRRWLELAAAHGIDTCQLLPRDIGALFHGKASYSWRSGIRTPSDCRGEPWRAVPAVAALAHTHQAMLREDCAVRSLDIEAGRITGVFTEDGRVATQQVVLAGGAWSSLFARQHGVVLPQLAVRATVAQTEPMRNFHDGAVADSKLALRRREDGGYSLAVTDQHGFFLGPDAFRHLLAYRALIRQSWPETRFHAAAPIGFPDAWSTPRHWSADDISPFERQRVLEPAPDRRAIDALARRFAERFAAVGPIRLRQSWAGMIDAMPDVVPVIDRVPDIEGLIIGTGMSGHGFGIGPGVGEILAKMVLGESVGYDMRRFRLARFSDGSRLHLGPGF